MKSKLFIGVLLVVLIAAGTGYYFFQKKVVSVANVDPDYSMTADELYNEFERDENAANHKYIDKVIEVTGSVDRFTRQESGVNIVLKAENAIAGGVNCAFSDTPEEVKPGDQITLKGRCQGLLLDVVLNNCSMVSSN